MPDEQFMRRALALAARAIGETAPNPMVGAVVVAKDGSVAGEGFHTHAGAPHAEAVALERAGESADGATLFVTLEPCHLQGRTPPCVDAIVAAGVARVVVAMPDPDAAERGAGIQRLREAGIAVDVGVCENEARRLNRMYICQRTNARPFVTLKMAQSLDGAIGTQPGERLRLTGDAADRHVRTLRHAHDGVMVGIDTVLVDDPQLTVRPYRTRQVPYRRIVVDSTARLPLKARLVKDQTRASTIVAHTDAAPTDRVAALASAGVTVLCCYSDGSGRIDLADLLRRLGAMQMLGVLCEGGPRLAASLLEGGLVDELHWIVAPVVLGTAAIAPVVAGGAGAAHFRVESVRRLDDDALIVAEVRDSNLPR